MEFCPTCGNMLQYEPSNIGHKGRLFCPTCPYVCELENKIKKRQPLVKKEIEAIFSGEDEMKYAAKTETSCPDCYHKEAYYHQCQTRSADEPSTTFFQCCKCSKKWKED